MQSEEFRQIGQLFARGMRPEEIAFRRAESIEYLEWAFERWRSGSVWKNLRWESAPRSNAADEYLRVVQEFQRWHARQEAEAERRNQANCE